LSRAERSQQSADRIAAEVLEEVRVRRSAPFAQLFRPAVVLTMLVAFVLSIWWVAFEHGLASAARQALYQPSSLLLVLAHPNLESVATLRDRLAGDAEYAKAGADILAAPLADPPFIRATSTLLRAIEAMPAAEPSAAIAAKTPRIYELRTYESHSDPAALNKLKMFNAGEVPIFRKTGLTPVFFGETLLGEKMPSLNYMLTFADMTARDAAWKAFSADPDWKTLSGDPQYKDNVSAISDIIMRPTAYSQL